MKKKYLCLKFKDAFRSLYDDLKKFDQKVLAGMLQILYVK